jgi:hypothetical protein
VDGSSKIRKTEKVYKARLAAKGYNQVYGVDYHDTHAPVARDDSNRVLLAVAAALKLRLTQADVSNAYLNATLEETVYMEQPRGFVVEGKEDYVCLCKKAIPGTKQGGNAWHKNVKQTLTKEAGMTGSKADSSVYVTRKGNSILIVNVHAGDLKMADNDPEMRDEVIRAMKLRYIVKNLVTAVLWLGMDVTQSSDYSTVYLSHYTAINAALEKYNMQDAKPAPTPWPELLTKDDCPAT